MCDEESQAGDLQVGGYASGEWAGRGVKPFLGLRADVPEVDGSLYRRLPLPGAYGQFQTSWGNVRYISPDQLESWAAAEWDYDGDEAA